jgi:hypothetical protein
MALKFLYITDPFVNNSEEFVRILAIANFPQVNSNGYNFAGQLYDQAGTYVASIYGSFGGLATDSTAYPYTFNGSFSAGGIIIVPPGWSFRNFGKAIAVQGTLEEVLRVH